MSTTNLLNAYHLDYFDLLKQAVDNPVRLELKSATKAASVRLNLYGFRRALLADQTADPTLSLLVTGLQFRLEENVLIIETREQSDEITAIRKGIANSKRS